MENITQDWQELEQKAGELEKTAQTFADEKLSLKIIPLALAYNKEEVNQIIDKAPFGKKIMTLAKHLGTDAKHAQLVLNQTQDEVSREAYAEEGDVFEKCEQNSMRIKNGAKVVGFVGGVVLSGGTSAVVASGALATTATVVVGADLVLEVTEDEARIALGDKNKVSEMVSNVRTVTEPASAILSITNISKNLSNSIDRLSAVTFGADQIRSVIQDEKVLGINIKGDDKGDLKVEISGVTEEELQKWKEENGVMTSSESIEEIINNAKLVIEKAVDEKIVEKESDAKKTGNKNASDAKKTDDKKQTHPDQSETVRNENQIYQVVNVSGSSYMMDACLSSRCWDDLDANSAENRDLGGIYTMGKVFGNGEGFKSGFRPSEVKESGKLVETSPHSYKITIYFAIAPFEGPKNKTIEYGTWLSESVEITANYGDVPVIEWDGNSLKQLK